MRAVGKRPPGQHKAMMAAEFIVVAVVIVAAIVALTMCMRSTSTSNAWERVRADIAAESARHYSISLGFAGDICLADNYIAMQHLAELGSTDIADGIDQRFIDIMRGMDLMWINNEFCYSDRGEPLDGKMYTFRSTPSNVKYLHDLGVDIAGLANNHTYDYGEEAFLDTLTTLEEAGIPYVGAGRNLDQAKGPVYLQADGFTIAYVAASCAEYEIFTPEATDESPGILWCYDNTRILESIREADANADFVVVLPHWGVEHSYEIENSQIEGAHAYIDAGADAVIGGHAHNLQGLEYYEGKPILYNLGNFWFDEYKVADTVVAEIRITGTRDAGQPASLENADIQFVMHPGTQDEVFTAYADTAEWRESVFNGLEGISVNATIDEDGVVHEV